MKEANGQLTSDNGDQPRFDSSIICLLDTSVVIDFLRNRESTVRIVSSWQDRGFIGVSVLTVCELFQVARLEEERQTEMFLEGLAVLELDRRVALGAGMMLSQLRREGRSAPIIDGLIAATALALDVPLITNDADHYVFPGLTVVAGR